MRTSLVKRLTAVIAVGFAVAAMSVAFDAITAPAALAATASAIDRDAKAALDKLYKNTPDAKALADKAVAMLVFPSIVKGGFIIAGQFGDGALRKNGKSVAYSIIR
jgi:lipid-binding SYLF domain-containing protein